MTDTIKFAGNLPCLPQGGSTGYLLHAKQPAVPSSPVRSLLDSNVEAQFLFWQETREDYRSCEIEQNSFCRMES